MEFLYKKAMLEYDLSIDELPADAKIGIETINDILKSQRMLEKVGKSLTNKALAKLKTQDKWVYFEILDYVNDTDNNDDEAPNLEDVEEEIENKLNDTEEEEEEMEEKAPSEQGLQIEQELERMFENGNISCTIEEVRNFAPKTYNLLFDTYSEGEENGVVTSKYSLIENNKIFTLTKK
jgi:hypothetical protein